MAAQIHIGAVESATGVSRDVLRMWERRYGFPLPKRDPLGDRRYTLEQVETLRLIKRLMDYGHRAGAVVGRPRRQLLEMLKASTSAPSPRASTLSGLFALVQDGRILKLRASLDQKLKQVGLRSFLSDVLSPLNAEVGTAWAAGTLPIFKEHAYVEAVQTLLRDAIQNLPPARQRPLVLFTTLPTEQHGLGLLMIQALYRLARVDTVSLGLQTPIDDIVRAADFHAADIVALSFSSAFARPAIQRELAALRKALPANVELWIGGGGVQRLRKRIPGTRAGITIDGAMELLQAWMTEHAPAESKAARGRKTVRSTVKSETDGGLAL